MSYRLLALTTSFCVLISGCATHAESPIYQQSTKYKVHAPDGEAVTQQATTSYATYTATTETRTAVQDQGAYNATTPQPQTFQAETPRYGEIVSSQRHDAAIVATSAGATYGEYLATPPVETTVTSLPPSAPSTITTAPTDSAYGDTFGTPGYHAMQANGEIDNIQSASAATPIPIPAPAPTPAPIQQPEYEYPQAAAQTYAPPAATLQTPAPLTGNSAHKVVEGDTVYSLSRKLCVGVDDIKNLNGLDGNFSIKLDDYIRLPDSRC